MISVYEPTAGSGPAMNQAFAVSTHEVAWRGIADRRKMSVVVVNDSSELAGYVTAWADLAASAIEPNVFYEPWMLIPAVKSFGAGKDLKFVFIFAPNAEHPLDPPLLCGFFPLERRARYKGLPIKTLGLWKHIHCYLCTPLLRKGCAAQALTAFANWIASGPDNCRLMDFNTVTADGPFHQLLVDHLYQSARPTFTSECFTRALFRPLADADSYLQAALSGEQRKKLRRKRRQLSEAGELEFAALGPDGDVNAWIENFLNLEASGWKGNEGSALACDEADRAFFAAITTEAFRQGRLMAMSINLDGRPIAQLCNFVSGEGCFAFKIAFDERYARFSPGVQLEVENIRHLHARAGIQWMDSCSASDSYLNLLLRDRRTVKSIVMATGNHVGGFTVSALPVLRWLNRTFVRRGFPGFFSR